MSGLVVRFHQPTKGLNAIKIPAAQPSQRVCLLLFGKIASARINNTVSGTQMMANPSEIKWVIVGIQSEESRNPCKIKPVMDPYAA